MGKTIFYKDGRIVVSFNIRTVGSGGLMGIVAKGSVE